ncbi:MAG: hypothetical protein JWN70_4721 [Planctomycetaceae bacterium]|nr:hypothetical protein [Planctomycetaceae bacterium]
MPQQSGKYAVLNVEDQSKFEKRDAKGPHVKRYSVSDEARDSLYNRFTHHPLIGDQGERFAQLRLKALELAILVNELTPVSREQSLALTRLEECVMHSISAIVRNETVDTPGIWKEVGGTDGKA